MPAKQPQTIGGILSLRLAALLLFAVVLASSSAAWAQTVTTFEGIDASQVPHPESDADPNGAIGTKQFMEWTNVNYQAYDKVTFAPVWSSPQPGPTPFINNGVTTCSNLNPGDGVIIFDNMASRWVLAGHSPGPNYYYCIAVSSTDDLSSANLKWYTYSFPLNSFLGTNAQGTTYFPDWPKLGAWPDGYYVGMDLGDPNNGFLDVAMMACAFDRTNMLIGAAANTPQCFVEPSPTPTSPYLAHSPEPADVQGSTAPPAGSPEYLVAIQNPVIDGVTNTSTSINLWQFHVDWTNPANTTLIQNSVPVTAYIPGCYSTSSPGNTQCVPQATTGTTGQHIDSVGDRMMFHFSYRNFGDYQSYLASHTVQVAAGTRTQTGIRWYELRGNGIPTVFQSGTLRPDTTLFRFMPSIAQDQSGNAAVGYSVSSSSTHPGMSASYWNLPAETAPTEISLFSGSGDEQNGNLWGDYSALTVDPVGGCAFWYVNEYLGANETGSSVIWKTRISTFSVPGCGSTGSPTLTLSPGSVNFGRQAFGTSSGNTSITVTNTGTTAVTFTSIAVTGANASNFPESTNCGSSLAGGSSCTIFVAFAPATAGTFSAAVTVTSNATGSPQNVSLSGTGVPPVVVNPGAIAFGNVVTGTTKAATIKVTNQMTVALTGIMIVASGAPFTQTNTCGSSLAPNTQCSITVTFAPTATGAQSGSITVTDSAPSSPQVATLRGTGVLPVSLIPGSLAFGQVTVGTSSAAKMVTVTNNEKVSVTMTSIVLGGSKPGDYSETNTCGTTLAAGATCSISVTFSPKAVGARLASVTLTDTGTNSPQVLPLAGTGK